MQCSIGVRITGDSVAVGAVEDNRVVGAIRAPKPGESKEETMERGLRDFFAFQETPFFRVWACAAVDEIISMLHERVRVGSLA